MIHINNIDQAKAYLKLLHEKMAKQLSDSELLERLLNKADTDEAHYEVVKNEIATRTNR